ncbi:T9SS type A sorting domain-containing protein [Hymenobacter sp. AT01-02]|uniref:T9SS type A sorting domain-containing protein n=1 Tax=Hymenobacter sp. AT01-02 TaxID=1571877 RepID=UPI0009EB50C2|nr:T9SS type A sorting domain-containing protein [Hymenobacter sp. AT01-02]
MKSLLISYYRLWLCLCVAWLAIPAGSVAQTPTWSALAVSPQPAGTTVRPNYCAAGPNGTVILMGSYTGVPQFGTLAPLPTGRFTGFIAKYDTRGKQWLWSTSIQAGTSYTESAVKSAAFTSTGDVVAVGYCLEGNLFGTLPTGGGGGREAFVAKLNGNTGQWVWVSTTQGFGIDADEATQVTLTSNGDPILTGFFRGRVSFGDNISFTSATATAGNIGPNAFVAKADGSTGQWQWATPIPGAESTGRIIAALPNGDVLTAGSFSGTAQFGALPALTSTMADTYVAKLTGSTGQWQWASQVAGPGSTSGLSIATTPSGEAFIAGVFSRSAQFGATPVLTAPSDSWPQAIFVAKVNGAGQWQWATQVNDYYYAPEPTVIATPSGDALVAGTFNEEATFGSLPPLLSAGNEDVFVAKLAGATGQWQWATRAGSSGRDFGYGLSLSPAGEPVVAGYCDATAAFGSFTTAEAGPFVAQLGSTVTATQNPAFAAQLQVFPNPASTHFTLRLPSLKGASTAKAIQVLLYNSLGQVVRRQLLPASTSGTYTETRFDVQHLSAGIYSLHFLIDNHSVRHQIVIQ